MARLNLLLADPDVHYVTRLADYLQARHSTSFSVSVATGAESLQQHLDRHRDTLDILAVCPAFTEGLYVGTGTVTVVLNDGGGSQTLPAADKYQRADRLAAELLRLYLEKHPDRHFMATSLNPCRLIGVYAAGGGVGASTVAAALGAMAHHHGKSALYLNLEGCDAPGAWFQEREGPSVSELFYHLKEGGQQLSMKLEALSYREPGHRVRCFTPAETLLDYQELDDSDLELLVQALRGMAATEAAVLDLGSGVDSRTLRLLELMDQILLVVADERIAQLKARRFMAQLPALERKRNADYRGRMVLVRNGRFGQGFEGDAHGLARVVTLPPDPCVKSAHSMGEALSGPFGQGILGLWSMLEIR